MKIGAHVSIAGGIFNAPENASSIGCETFQVFSRSPRGGPAPKLTADVLKQFKAAMVERQFSDFVIHTPYYINFASTNPRIKSGSIEVVRDELERGTKLGAAYVITHMGSAKDVGQPAALKETWLGVQKLLKGYKGTTGLLLEIAAGQGDAIGSSFSDLAKIIKEVEKKPELRSKVNVCLDTCHAFAAGYDLRTAAAVNATVTRIDKEIGIKRVKWIHGNDSKFGLSEHRDRHEHIGKGKIGSEGFRALLNHPKLKHAGLVLETEPDAVVDDIRLLMKLRKGKASL